MGRIFMMTLAVALFVGVGVAAAGETTRIRLPIEVSNDHIRSTSVTVERGDHLWKISARHLRGTTRPVTPYWREVIEVNTPRLRSGDPNLIYPGEVIELP